MLPIAAAVAPTSNSALLSIVAHKTLSNDGAIHKFLRLLDDANFLLGCIDTVWNQECVWPHGK
jgi:hypothetical protein